MRSHVCATVLLALVAAMAAVRATAAPVVTLVSLRQIVAPYNPAWAQVSADAQADGGGALYCTVAPTGTVFTSVGIKDTGRKVTSSGSNFGTSFTATGLTDGNHTAACVAEDGEGNLSTPPVEASVAFGAHSVQQY